MKPTAVEPGWMIGLQPGNYSRGIRLEQLFEINSRGNRYIKCAAEVHADVQICVSPLSGSLEQLSRKVP